MGFMEFLPLIGDVVSGLFGNKATSSANSTNLQLNRENNAANRANMERQNQLNIEQWNRENAYNSPAAQMGRFTAAGLNPNLIYGQTNTAPQLSGSLGSSTSQAGSVMPNDAMSKMFGKLGETLMRIPMYREELKSKKLDNEMKEIQRNDMLRNTRADAEANDALIENWDEFINNPIETYYKCNAHYPRNKVLSKLYKVAHDYKLAQNLSEEQRERIFYNGLNSETKKYVVSRLAAETKYSEAQADNAFTLFSQQALGVKAQTSMAIKADEFFTIEKILQLGDQAVSIIANGFNAVYGGKLTTVTEHLGPKGYSYTRSSSSRK